MCSCFCFGWTQGHRTEVLWVIQPVQDPGPCPSPRWFCAALKTQLAAAASPIQPPLQSSGTMLPRTCVPFGKCNSVVRLLHALTIARTACSSDTDHSFVLGIVLDSCNRFEHASASRFSTWMQRVLPHFTPCTHRPAHRAHLSLPAHQGQHLRSQEESLLPALHTPWTKALVFSSQSPFQVLNNDEKKSGNFTQERPKTKQMN